MIESVASTQCPACGERVLHPANLVLTVVRFDDRARFYTTNGQVLHECKAADVNTTSTDS